jgi:hypothetical protein
VNTSLKVLSVSAIGSTAPCQTPWNATTQPWGSGFGVPPVRASQVEGVMLPAPRA